MKKLLVISLLLFACFTSIGQTDEEKEIFEQAVFRVQKNIEEAERLKIDAFKTKELLILRERADAQLEILKVIADVKLPQIIIASGGTNVMEQILEQEKIWKKGRFKRNLFSMLRHAIVLTFSVGVSVLISVFVINKFNI